MARIRTLKPEFWSDEELSSLPEATHMLAAALLNYADDHGYFNANQGLVRAACSPLREPSVSIPESLRSLQTIGYLRLGTGPDGKRYGFIVKFREHQRVSHPTDSKISPLSITWDSIESAPEEFRKPPEEFRPEQGTGNRERNREEEAPAIAAASPSETSPAQSTFHAEPCPTGTGAKKPVPMTVAQLIVEGVSRDAAEAWFALRKSKRAPLTVYAWALTRKEIDKAGWTPDAAVQKAVKRNWVGIEAEWLGPPDGTPPTGPRPAGGKAQSLGEKYSQDEVIARERYGA